MKLDVSKELSLHRLEQAKEEINVSRLLFNDKYFKSANSRAYYSIFYSIRSVLALESIDFRRHKDVLRIF